MSQLMSQLVSRANNDNVGTKDHRVSSCFDVSSYTKVAHTGWGDVYKAQTRTRGLLLVNIMSILSPSLSLYLSLSLSLVY